MSALGESRARESAVARLLAPGKVALVCAVPGCLESRAIAPDPSLPADVVTILAACPEHEASGEKQGGERYFDRHGAEVF